MKDGGSPVLGYIIERCEEGTDNWVRCNPRLVPDLTYKVSSFLLKCHYVFSFGKELLLILNVFVGHWIETISQVLL